MNARQQTLEYIRVEVAMNGRVTREALRTYIDNRIGSQAFNETVSKGMQRYNQDHPEVTV